MRIDEHLAQMRSEMGVWRGLVEYIRLGGIAWGYRIVCFVNEQAYEMI